MIRMFQLKKSKSTTLHVELKIFLKKKMINVFDLVKIFNYYYYFGQTYCSTCTCLYILRFFLFKKKLFLPIL